MRLEIQLDSVDKTLDDELSLDHTLDNALLLFAGSEILSAFDLELLGVGHYRISAVRARFDTKHKTHPAGEGVFVVRLNDLARFPQRTSRPSTNYKLQSFTLQHERDLRSITPVPFALQYHARRPLYPLNLRVNGYGRAALPRIRPNHRAKGLTLMRHGDLIHPCGHRFSYSNQIRESPLPRSGWFGPCVPACSPDSAPLFCARRPVGPAYLQPARAHPVPQPQRGGIVPDGRWSMGVAALPMPPRWGSWGV